MSFVKLDCGILDSTLWIDREAREIMITALLMAEPREVVDPLPTLEIRSLERTDFEVPPGWYGFVPAAGTGIARRAGIGTEDGLDALERLAAKDLESRTPDHGGRRMVRVSGGFVILNFDKYRRKDHTAAERSRRYRERLKSESVNGSSRVTTRSVTQAEAEAEKYKLTSSTQFPPLKEEVLEWAKQSRVTRRFAADLYAQLETGGWTDKDGEKLRSWKRYFRRCAKEADAIEPPPRKPRPAPTPPPPGEAATAEDWAALKGKSWSPHMKVPKGV